MVKTDPTLLRQYELLVNSGNSTLNGGKPQIVFILQLILRS